MWPLINLQDVLHAGYESRVGLRRDDPLLLEVRLESVFLSVRPIVLSLARSTMFSCTTAVSTSVSVHRLRPFGGGEQASAINFESRSSDNAAVSAIRQPPYDAEKSKAMFKRVTSTRQAAEDYANTLLHDPSATLEPHL
jgi:hypothetical protein